MPEDNDQILDPAHDPDGGTNVGAAGIPAPEAKGEKKPDEVVVSEDGNIVERGGVKYMRAEALHNERQARQNAERQLAALAPVMPEFEEFLKTRENRKTAVRESVASGGEQDDKEYLQEVATALGFYDETNQPDLRRAQAHLNITRREAGRVTDKRVRPVEESSQLAQARANRERARGQKFVDGQPIADDKYLEAAYNALPEEYLADPQVAALTQVIAAGLQHLDERKSGVRRGQQPQRRQQSGEPMFVERSTGRFDDGEGEISQLDIAAARARGKSPEEWAKMSKKVNTTRGVLEEV
jgi:hypothetical protein